MNSPSDRPIRYLTASDLYNINSEIMQGDTLVRDLHLLNSAARRPALVIFGQAQFPTLLDKAAALLHSLAYHHLFMDGNKRTAVFAITSFLKLNGYELTWDDATQCAFVLEVAQGQHDVLSIARWLEHVVSPIG